jgi:fructose-bisphosphate aldolase, class I
MNDEMLARIREGQGFLAALDQSGGSTPKALAAYGIGADAYSGEAEMFDRVHEMRTRIITSPAFTGERILGAILFEGTMDRDIDGMPSARYLWLHKQIVPFVKVDQGLAEAGEGVQLLRPMPELDALLSRARAYGVFGTKMRSVIQAANVEGIAAIVTQQAQVGQQILDAGLVPILEPEVDIHAADKQEAEQLLREQLLTAVERLSSPVMLKLTIPTEDGFYSPLIEHPDVLRVVALSGGYSRDEANARLARNPGLIASFSRALIGDLSYQQPTTDFDRSLDDAVRSIYDASVT